MNKETFLTESAYNQLSNSEKAGYKPQWEYLEDNGLWEKSLSQPEHGYKTFKDYSEWMEPAETRLVYYPITPDNSEQTFTRAKVDAIIDAEISDNLARGLQTVSVLQRIKSKIAALSEQ
jgi:hypothetical protein